MHNIDIKKLLTLLIGLVLYINYQNYLKPNTKKLRTQNQTLKTNTAREIEIQNKSHTKKSLALTYGKILFDGKKYSYSKAMGEMQNHIYAAAKGGCEVRSVKWAQVPNTKLWYDKLRMNTRLNCTPKQLLSFTNRLKNKKVIYLAENFTAQRYRKKPYLDVRLQLIGFRKHHATK